VGKTDGALNFVHFFSGPLYIYTYKFSDLKAADEHPRRPMGSMTLSLYQIQIWDCRSGRLHCGPTKQNFGWSAYGL